MMSFQTVELIETDEYCVIFPSHVYHVIGADDAVRLFNSLRQSGFTVLPLLGQVRCFQDFVGDFYVVRKYHVVLVCLN